MKSGRIYKEFRATNGKSVVLRALRWDDLDAAVDLVRGLVDDRASDPGFGTLLDKKYTRDEEAEWLARQLVAIEKGDIISVAAEVDGRLIANSEVTRGSLDDVRDHGNLGIVVSNEYRSIGIGTEMLRTLIDECTKEGLRTIELQVLKTNPRALALYEGLGFVKVGVIAKKVHRGGRFIDVLLMSKELSEERSEKQG
jgi:RimJ/RimL family protein N-acetyltransferase